MYKRVWDELKCFCSAKLASEDANLPVSVATLSLFLASLFAKGYAPSTLTSYNSAIGYLHKLNGLEDPSSSVFIIKFLQGARKTRAHVDTRLPITISILHKLVAALNTIASNVYYKTLYQSMFLTAFYGLLRVGEMTTFPNDKTTHCLKFRDIERHALGFTLIFRTHKYSLPGRVSKVVIKRQPDSITCPVLHMQSYLSMRGNNTGYLFIHPDGTPVSRSQFTDVLNNALSFIGLSPTSYKGHSFRIGSCTWHMEQGFTDTQLRSLGRWRSNAFLKYIRP